MMTEQELHALDVPKKTDGELKTILQTCPAPGQCFIHYKTQTVYIVICNAIREHDQTPIVIYRKAGEFDAPYFARPLREWIEILPDGVSRFRSLT